MTDPGSIVVRRALPEDRPAILDLCRASLGWREDDPSEAFFAWKHDENPFGPSPAWVAASPDGRLVGLRVFMRWGFVDAGGDEVPVVRAVDTATHPDWQGRGIFTRLTLGALPELADLGVRAVFNTPNDKSRPGYLKMGWQDVGRVPVAVRLRSPLAVRRLAGARAAAEKWSRPVDVGVDAAGAFGDLDSVARLLERAEPRRGLRTRVTPEQLRWRYSFGPLRYRVVPLGDDLAHGVLVVRVRRRGAALELTLSDVLAPRGAAVGRAVRDVLRRTGADFAIRTPGPSGGAGFVPAPRIGPILVWRDLAGDPTPGLGELSLALGDVELF